MREEHRDLLKRIWKCPAFTDEEAVDMLVISSKLEEFISRMEAKDDATCNSIRN